MQNIVTWGQNMSANIEEFACISIGGLFSGVPPYLEPYLPDLYPFNHRLCTKLSFNALKGPGGPLVFQAGYHPCKRTFKTHPKHVFFRYESRP